MLSVEGHGLLFLKQPALTKPPPPARGFHPSCISLLYSDSISDDLIP